MLLIHGSSSCGAELAPLAEALRPFTSTHAPNLVGHGGRPIPERFSIGDFARDLVEYLDREGIERTFVTGYSSGGLVGLHLARHYPQRVLGVCAIATKYVFDAKTVAQWTYLASMERYNKPGDKRRPELERIHAPQDWSLVSKTNSRLYEDYGHEAPLSDADLQAIKAPVLLVSSNRDQIVPWDETLALAKLLAHSEVVMFYGPAHPIAVVPLAPVARAIATWMEKVRKA
jgi:pimeloyl-ACP methyl ester carboxylesterase